MNVAYVDTSAIVAVAFDEAGADAVGGRIEQFSRLVSSNLLEAEVRATCHREGRPVPSHLLTQIDWVHVSKPLSQEMKVALSAGSLRGADLWHVATALHAAPEPGAISFFTLDRRQGRVAAALGFRDAEAWATD